MTDESDSSFVFKKRMVKIEPDENDDIPKPIQTRPAIEPPIVIQKAPSPIIPKVVSVKPISRLQSPNKNRIDKIALNLKIQQEKKLKTPTRTLKDYQQILLENLNKNTFSDDDSLTNLNWLNNFSLSSTGILPLSPPPSPSDESDGCFYPKVRIKNNSTSKPNYTFSCLIFLAIESSNNKRLSVKEINQWIIDNFSFYKNFPSGSWKNLIRHNLATNQCFSKVDKNLLTMRDFSGKGSLWCVNPIYRPMLLENLTRVGDEYEKLNSLPCLQDVMESPKNDFNSRASRITQSKPAIINPKLINNKPKITSVKPRSTSKNDSVCTDMEAVNALLSMKSRASSMPAVDSKKGRRKQLFKPPKRRLDLPDDDDPEDLIDEMEDIDNEAIVDDSDNENMLQIDESFSQSEEESKRKNDSNETFHKEKKAKLDKTESQESNPLLELSRAASIVEDLN